MEEVDTRRPNAAEADDQGTGEETMTTSRRLAAALFASAVVAAAAFGQRQPATPPSGPPNGPYGPYGAPPQGPALQGYPVSPPGVGLQADGGASSYPPPQYVSPFSPYGQPYIQSPAAGYLDGAASVITAQGNYENQVQQARILESQADMSKLDLRRRMIEQQRYLKSLEPTPEELRQQEIQNNINRSRHNPPPTEIWSGKALNDLLIAIQRDQRGGVIGPAVPVDPTVLSHINLTTGTTTAGVGMLKDLRRFHWPLPLLDDAFNDQRTQLETLARQAADEAPSGMVDPRLQRDLQRGVNGLIAALKGKVDDYTPTQYIQSMRYLRELNDSFKVLQDPNVASYFSDKYRATGSTVAELVQNMNARGLTFAPAATGEEPYYTTLYSRLASYDYGLHQLASR
jgi:hypothetical protein